MFGYPNTNFHELNIDWVIGEIMKLRKEYDEFKVVNKISFGGAWDITRNYAEYTIVDLDGNGYISIKPVPAGVPIDNEDYWRLVANYSALYADFQNRIIALEHEYTIINTKISDLKREVLPFSAYNAIGDGTSHPLSQRYSTLEEAQEKYPCALSLSDEIDFCAIQQYILDSQDNKTDVVLTAGNYVINRQLTIDLERGKISFYGSGTNTTTLKAINNDVFNILYVKGKVGEGVAASYMTMRDFNITGHNKIQHGIMLEICSFVAIYNVLIQACNVGLRGNNVDHSRFYNVSCRWNNFGSRFASDDYVTYTAINNLSFFGCTFSNNVTIGVQFVLTSGCGLYNCNVEYNGINKDTRESGGIVVVNAGGQGVTGLMANDCYIEGNKGLGAIVIDQQFGAFDSVFNVNGCCFNHTTESDVYADIYVIGTSAHTNVLNENGCGSKNYSAVLPPGYKRTFPETSTATTIINRVGNLDL